jgi:hypothetical protein
MLYGFTSWSSTRPKQAGHCKQSARTARLLTCESSCERPRLDRGGREGGRRGFPWLIKSLDPEIVDDRNVRAFVRLQASYGSLFAERALCFLKHFSPVEYHRVKGGK